MTFWTPSHSPWVVIAQWIEHPPGVRKVMCSNPIGTQISSRSHTRVTLFSQFMLFFTSIRWPVILKKQPKAKRRVSVWRPWSSLTPCFVRHQPSPLKLFFQAANQFIFGRKKPFAFPPKDCALFHVDFFHIKMKQLCLDQTQKQCLSEVPFQNRFETGNQLNAGVSYLLDYQKCPLSQPISIQ